MKDTSHRAAGTPPREAITRVLTDGADEALPQPPAEKPASVSESGGDSTDAADLPADTITDED